MKFKVCIDYQAGPAFETTLEAASAHSAEAAALAVAKQCGFVDWVKKITVVQE